MACICDGYEKCRASEIGSVLRHDRYRRQTAHARTHALSILTAVLVRRSPSYQYNNKSLSVSRPAACDRSKTSRHSVSRVVDCPLVLLISCYWLVVSCHSDVGFSFGLIFHNNYRWCLVVLRCSDIELHVCTKTRLLMHTPTNG